jgi:DNA-binding transcriptional regulator LsrR (DeoR family)
MAIFVAGKCIMHSAVIWSKPGKGWCDMGEIDLDKMAVEIARKHLLENINFKKLSEIYYAAPSTIHRRLKKWLEEGRFTLQDKQVNNGAKIMLPRDEILGEELVRKTGIWRTRVVQISGVDEAFTDDYLCKPDSEQAQKAYRASDELHRCLGEIAGELLLNSLRKNMTIGVSSGRGVGFTVESLKKIVQKAPSWATGYEGIRLVSLCGGAHIGTWEYANSQDFDADENVFSLSSLLKVSRQNIHYMNSPISKGWQNKEQEKRPKINLDLAIIGLGQLNTQHHYLRDHPDLQLKSMSEQILKISEWQNNNPELRDNVAEIVLRLYPAVRDNLPDGFVEIIKETNNRILSVSPDAIRSAGELILIAGGKQKVNALTGVLRGDYPDSPIIRKNVTLITDSWTAQEILKTTR